MPGPTIDSVQPDASTPGPLFAIGGAEAKLRRRTVLRSFLEAAGGEQARIAVIPSASALGDEVVDVYRAVFTSLGAAEVINVRPESRAEAHDQKLVDALDSATGVFMTGGNQLKLSSHITGTPVGAAIEAAHLRGAVVGGTSAGASILAEHMIAFGGSGSTPKQRMSQLAVGLGLVRGVVIDQHFQQRNRYGRLMSIVAQSPALLGLGVDEDTAAVITADQRLRVVGRGSVVLIDGSQVVSNSHSAHRTAPLLFSGAQLHLLPAGAEFDLNSRQLIQVVTELPPGEAEEVAAAEADLRQLAREIAAEGVSPSHYARRVRRRTKSS
ncbi:cyanophycinase [Propionibacteriaceae bacterium Y1700]|uniref:cyanophycinase n=1 Tax=Microlunatus sp. Y1700 TaxID=3418487 RepID=UPI003DA78D4E